MPVSIFRDDLQQASKPGRYDHLQDVKPGDSDFSISFRVPASEITGRREIDFLMVVSDAHDYPKNHNFLVTASDSEISGPIPSLVDDFVYKCQEPDRFSFSTINEALSDIESMLSLASQVQSHGESCPSPAAETPESETSDSSQGSLNFNNDSWSDSPPQTSPLYQDKMPHCYQKMLERDVEMARTAGFRVGYFGDANTGPLIVSVSCQISRLCISKDTLRAWDIDRSEYLILLIRFPRSYHTLHEVFRHSDVALSGIEIRVGLCDYHYPSIQATLDIFQSKQTQDRERKLTGSIHEQPAIKDIFISYSLHHVMNRRFLAVAGLRKDFNLSWTGGELFFHKMQGRPIDPTELENQEYWNPDTWSTPAPHLLASDHFLDSGMNISRMSLPLLAMQYTLRHFARCTEFCLVCHCKMTSNTEAVRPYVCSTGLCLFQYLELGLGSRIEYEIRSQPMVVDLLVSLAYACAVTGSLEDFPSGLSLQVPNSPDLCQVPHNTYHQHTKVSMTADLDPVRMTLQGKDVSKIASRDWIIVSNAETHYEWHCQATRDSSNDDSSQVILSAPRKVYNNASISNLDPSRKRTVNFLPYDRGFDQLSKPQKQLAVKAMLDTLPSIPSISDILGKSRSQRLRQSLEGCVSPAALDLLRWIIASNRSYIVEETGKVEGNIPEMNTHARFRFVQGAPDREERFAAAVKEHAKNNHPSTISAWHGSPVSNWHSILRQGLHFEKIANGRANGNGVYFSPNFGTSLGYSNCGKGNANWPQSSLNINYVIALNDIVNCPQKFVCQSPHYVVQFRDWIQPKYLLIGQYDQNSPVYHSPYAYSQPLSASVIPNHTRPRASFTEGAHLTDSQPTHPSSAARAVAQVKDEEQESRKGNPERRPMKKTRKDDTKDLDATWNSPQEENVQNSPPDVIVIS